MIGITPPLSGAPRHESGVWDDLIPSPHLLMREDRALPPGSLIRRDIDGHERECARLRRIVLSEGSRATSGATSFQKPASRTSTRMTRFQTRVAKLSS